jgi:hypothetical protein
VITETPKERPKVHPGLQAPVNESMNLITAKGGHLLPSIKMQYKVRILKYKLRIRSGKNTSETKQKVAPSNMQYKFHSIRIENRGLSTSTVIKSVGVPI